MIPDGWVWPVFAGLFLVSWGALYAAFPAQRAVMGRTSGLTVAFGLLQPLFVPDYWNPPSLFGLAQRTGYDLESLAFAFAVGGVGAVLLPVLVGGVPTHGRARRLGLERPPGATLALPFVFWMPLTATAANPIHACLGSLAAGLAFTLGRRPDLGRRCMAAGVAFTAYYALFLAGLDLLAPGYFGRVWNVAALWPVRPAGIPLEEPLFAFLFGAYGAAVHEHARWLVAAAARGR